MPVPLNPDLPSSWELPGVYFSVNLAGQGGGIGALDKRLLVTAYKLASGTKPFDAPVLVTSQQDANDFFGRGSDAARIVAAALSHVGAGVIDIWGCPIAEPSGGTLATHLIVAAGTATAAGSADVYVCGYRASIPIASGDTATIVGANLAAEINKLLDLPVTAAAVTGTVTLTARHKGFVGNDLPVRVDQFGAAGITFSPGTITYGSGPAVGAGSVQVGVSSTTITAAVTGGDTVTVIATNIAAAINAGGFPVTATSAAGVVTLFYARERYVHRISSQIITSTGVTVTLAVGTQPANSGTERPNLTQALTNIAGLAPFSVWVTAFNEVTSLGTLDAHIETQANGINQKGQTLHFGQTTALATAGAVPPATSPTLTASSRPSLEWCPESPQQEYELSARAAAMVAAEDYAPRNYDGKLLKTNADVPLLLPHRAVRPSSPDLNAAIHTYYMTPLAVNEAAGALAVVSGKTTSSSSNAVLHDWGAIRHIDFLRGDFSANLTAKFSGVNLRRNGTPHTPNTVTINDIRDASFVRASQLDAVDLYDGAEAFKAGFTAEPDAIVPGRVNCFIPMALIRSLHQLGVVGAPA
jgi:phage tail sheath gpL-like